MQLIFGFSSSINESINSLSRIIVLFVDKNLISIILDQFIDIDYFNRLGGKTKSNQRLKEEGDTSFEKKWETKKEGFELSKEYLELVKDVGGKLSLLTK